MFSSVSTITILYYVTFLIEKSSFGAVVKTLQGVINGTEEYSRDGRLFHSFYGIPYAKAPVGELRFRPPQEPPSWNDTLYATEIPPICSQITLQNKIAGQEDCLYLNVFTPKLRPVKPLPVLVYIHGGVFRMRSGDAGPHYFMDHDIVFVTFNYRLGIFGFLSTGDEVIPGNYGLKDQVAALKWVQNNIFFFGGDPDTVTLNGMSSGAICAHLLCLSPLSQGLFHRVILQSGSALSHWSHYSAQEARNLTMNTIAKFNCGKSDSKDFLPCLQNVSSYELVKTEETSDNLFKFLPVVEKADLPEAIITSPPAALGYFNENITMMLGFTANEDDIFLTDYVKTFSCFRIFMLNQLSDFFITGCLPCQFKYNASIRNELIYMFKSQYYDNKYLSKENIASFSDLMSDMSIIMPLLDTALTYPGKKYLYLYNYTNAATAAQQSQVPYRGAIHSDDGITLHSYPVFGNLSIYDHRFSRKHVAYWANFVITGNPNSQNLELPFWNPVFSPFLEYLYMSNESIIMKCQPFKDRYRFWRDSGISIFDAESYISETISSPGYNSWVYDILTPVIWILSFLKNLFNVVSSIDDQIWSWV